MFAAQLLRVLETAPLNSRDNTCTAFDMVEKEANMSENQNWATFDDDDKDEFWKRSEFKWDNDLHSDKRIHENGFENKKENDSCADEKNVTDCELPELEVCYIENPIKDICVDDGENVKSLVSEPEMKVELEIESLASEEFEYLKKDDYDSVVGYNNEVNHSESGEKADDKCSLGKSSEQKSLKTLLDSRTSDGSDVEYLSNQMKHRKSASENLAEGSPDDDSKKGISNFSYNSKTDSGAITFDFNSIKIKSEIVDECLDNKNNKTSNALSHENKAQLSQGESSFSMAGGPVSGIVNHSGSIPFSGSISIRSDSSTTSARSFAFPTLPNEWNSSPVRMAKADRRRYRNAKCWRNGLFCCRF